MNKKVMAIIIILIAIPVIYILYPKNAGSFGGFGPGPPQIQKTERNCIGFTFNSYPGGFQYTVNDAPTTIKCIGIVTGEKKCYTRGNDQGNIYVEIPNCEVPDTWQGVLELCPENTHCAQRAIQLAIEKNETYDICNSTDIPYIKNHCEKTNNTFNYNQ